MALKSAAFLALVGTCLVTILLLVDFMTAVSGVMNDIMPAMTLLRSLIFLIASVFVTIFFFVFHRAQP